MPKPKSPRHGSMQYWPRKRASKPYARVRSFASEGTLQAFAGYKMGMTHVMAIDTDKNSATKGETLALPATIIECPPITIYAVRGYTSDAYGKKVATDVVVGKGKHLARKAPTKTGTLDSFDPSQYEDVSILVATQPEKTGIGQKKPQVFEMALGGKTAQEKFDSIKELVGKEIKASELFAEGDLVDIHAVSKGYGYQGPVKRFGIGLKHHKSEKGRRRPGSLGGWSAQQHVMYRVPMAGQMGYHQRVQYHNQILKITNDPKEVNVSGGFIHYGVGREGNEFIVLRGSIPGPKKRMVTLVRPVRSPRKVSLPTVETISLASPQGK